jgi:CheY-like chemotaxis protein
VDIVVRDTGQGILPAILPHIFDRFRQADGSTTRPHGGLGLGLAIARSIVELHGGVIEAASSGEGHGSTFRVRLPVGKFAEPRGPRRKTMTFEALAGARVVIVDDQEDERALLRAIFEQEGTQIQSAGSVDEALALMRSWEPDLIVSDLAMPHQDGYALMRQVREITALRKLPAIAVTAHARPEDRDAALSASFDAYISKPIDREDLLSQAVKLLASKRVHDGSPTRNV